MSGKTVLITGASGFVGCRLAERIALGTPHRVIAMVRRFTGAGVARLGRLPVKLVAADLLDLDSLTRVAREAEVIVHLAYGNRGSRKEREEITVSGTRNVMKAALRAGAGKVLYGSTAAVHGLQPKDPVVHETAAFQSSRDVYRASKAEAERIVWACHRKSGLPVVVFRPPLVYGPYGQDWTMRIVKEIQTGAVLVNGGNGAANLVYVDNLVDAFLLALEKNTGDGEAFFVVDDEKSTWREVYEGYAAFTPGHPPFQDMAVHEIEALRKLKKASIFSRWVAKPLHVASDMMKASAQSPEIRNRLKEIPWMAFAIRLFPKHLRDVVKGASPNRLEPSADTNGQVNVRIPAKDLVDLYASRSRFSNDKIKRLLGYEQRIAYVDALLLTHAWLRHQRLVP